MRKLYRNLLVGVVLTLLLMVGAQAAEITDLYITPAPEAGQGDDPPGEATSNSIFTIHFTWKEPEDGKKPEPGSLMIGFYTPYSETGDGFTWSPLPIPDEGRGRPDSDEGRAYSFRISAGLNLAATNFVGTRNTAHPIHDLQDVLYIPGLTYDPTRVEPLKVYIKGVYKPDPDEGSTEPPEPEEVGPEYAEVIIHDSHPRPRVATVQDPGITFSRYAGVQWDRDFLYAYDQHPNNWAYPIQSFALNENFQWRVPDDSPNPDDGTTSTCWEFRVIYVNSDNLPPQPYLNNYGGSIGDGTLGWHWYHDWYYNTGVVLYLKNSSWGTSDFVALPMQKVDQADNNYADGVEYFAIVEPESWNQYIGLPIGEYEYFFACSDDYIRTQGGAIPSWLDHELVTDPDTLWPVEPNVLLPKSACDLPLLDRNSHLDWRDMTAYNSKIDVNGSGLYVSRPSFQPGITSNYPWELRATLHPVVTVGLQDPSLLDPPWESTVSPFYRMVNPNNGDIQIGGAQNQKFDFRIKYQHLYGVLPESSQGAGYEISVWINDSNNTNPGTDPKTVYRRYTLTLEKPTPTSPPPTASEVKAGVIYHLAEPIQLSPGPHSYFFTASDGNRQVRFPVDGHGYFYGGVHAFRGPYVNNKPTLESPSVDPPTGTAGDKFTYRILYKDADNQRPYSAKIYIEYQNGSVLVGDMTKVNPSDSDFDGVGVWYKFDTANLAQQFQEGQRRYYFEFTDNWGAVDDPRSNIRGETVYYNSARPESWIDGPYINRNTIPQLVDGAVVDTDGANNSSTLFEYRVRYIDIDNQEPKYIDVYIGQKQDNGTISWDNGHRMDPTDPTDKVYSGDGVWYRYYSQLTGSAAGKDYYYCFVASDGYDVAEWDAVKSPSAGTVWYARDAAGNQLHKGERLNNASTGTPASVFNTSQRPLVGPIPLAPTYNPYTRPTVYTTAGGDFPGAVTIDYVNGVITSATSATQADVQYWFATPGPTDVGLNHPPTLITGSVSPNPGESTQEFTYRVTYTDPDGTMGQPPYYIRVRIDGTSTYPMTRVSGAEPDYKSGVQYEYRTTALTPQLPHHFYFEASDGNGFAVFDANGSRSSDQPIGAVSWIAGPYVNNKPTLTAPTAGAVFPAPGTAISTSQWVNFSVIYKDANNEWPGTLNPTVSKPPVVYIRKVPAGETTPPIPAPEPNNDFRVRSVTGTTITAEMPTGANVAWTTDEFKGLPVQFTSGTGVGTCYRIVGNTATTLSLLAQPPLSGVAAGNTFSIGKIVLNKDPVDNNCADAGGTLYEFRLNSLGEGSYAVHFRSETEELIGTGNMERTTVLRYPASGEITGLTISSTAPPGNQAPTLTAVNPTVDPVNGLNGSTFRFKITYADPNGDAPNFHDMVVGYVKLVIDQGVAGKTAHTIDMTVQPLPNYVTGAEFMADVLSTGLTPPLDFGEHSYYFIASDGWVTTRYPALGQPDLKFTINRPPGLSEAKVVPDKGNVGMNYTYSVKFSDPDGIVPPAGNIVLWLGRDDGSGGRTYTPRPMTLDTSGGSNVVAGVLYAATVPGTDLEVGASGANDFYITATDGAGETAPATAAISSPWVHPNTAPVLSNARLTPADHQWAGIDYTYKVIYSDEHGDPPAFMKLDVYLNGAGAPLTFDMVKTAGQDNFATGVEYTYTRKFTELGAHTYAFRANDHNLDSNVLTGSGPNVIAKPVPTLTLNPLGTTPAIGQSVNITGTMTPAPSPPATLTITFTRPDDTLQIETVTTASNGTFSKPWTPTMTGTWRVQASYAGDDSYGSAASNTIAFSVTGPSQYMSGLDMISIPLDLADSGISSVFGDGSYALAKYVPLWSDYSYYRSAGGSGGITLPLSDIELGAGYWIKVYGGGTLNVAPSGNPVSQTSNQLIHLDPGWNQIGCPFTSSVNWGALRVRVGTETLDLPSAAARGWVYSYGWGFEQSAANPYTGQYLLVDPSRNGALTTIDPWRGYWIKAMRDCYLVVPPPSTRGTQASRTLAINDAAAKWEVGLSASCGDLEDSSNGLGSGDTAFRIEAPRYLSDYIDLYFTDEKSGVYAYDVRSNASDGTTWYFKVATDQTDGLVRLEWTGIEKLPAGSILTLVDQATGQSVRMKSGQVYTFPAAEAEGGRLFRVILGAK